jgi:acid phosphatase family membrane protein YuiD
MEPIIKIMLMVTISWVFAEVAKVVVDYVRTKSLKPRLLLAYGGMPSTHSAFVVSLALSILLVEGLNSAFLVAGALVIIVLRDVITLRNRIDAHSKDISVLSKGKMNTPTISHTIPQIIVGIIIGIIFPVLLNLVF